MRVRILVCSCRRDGIVLGRELLPEWMGLEAVEETSEAEEYELRGCGM